MTPNPTISALKAGEAALRVSAQELAHMAYNCEYQDHADQNYKRSTEKYAHAETLAALAAKMEREAEGPTREELMAENMRLRRHIAKEANSVNIVGSAYHKAQEALDEIVSGVKRRAREALIARATPPIDAPFADDAADQARDEPFGRESKIKPGYFEDDMP